MTFTPPRWRLTRWLLEAGTDVPTEIRGALIQSLYGTLPIFAGGVINTIAVAMLIAWRNPQGQFRFWIVAEVTLCLVRLLLLIADRKAAAEGRRTFTDFYAWLGVSWAASVGYGTFISVLSGDWIAATLACLSSAAMVGGICFRNFAAPRLVALMILLSLGPCAVSAAISGQPILLVVALQIPFYLVSMTIAAFRLNRMLVATMRAERDNRHRARHDDLTCLLNRSGLQQAFAETAAAGQAPRALLYLDLDGFKGVNDRLGHAAGDGLLKAVADHLRAITGPRDIIARIGGDEFVVLTCCDREAALRLGQKIVSAVVEHEYRIDQNDMTVGIGVSIGIAACSDGSSDLQTLMGRADTALYKAKSTDAGCLLEGVAPTPHLKLVPPAPAATRRSLPA